MTETYEEFIANKIKELDLCIVSIYNEYETRALSGFFEYDNNVIVPENSDTWFDYYFVHFINYEYRSWIDEYQLLQLDRSNNFVFKEQLLNDYYRYDKTNDKDDIMFIDEEDILEQFLKSEINEKFIDNYIYNILNFEHFKNILYENDIYPEVFAEEVELK